MGTMTVKRRAEKQRKSHKRIAALTRKARAKLDGAIGGGG